jgi:hypothetical protein
MPEGLSPELEREISELCKKIAASRGLSSEVEEELYGHLEDKALGYIGGDESLSDADVALLIKEHFGDQGNLKAMLGEIHGGRKYSLADELTACGFGGNKADDFWGVEIFPWKKANRFLYSAYAALGTELLIIFLLGSIQIVDLFIEADLPVSGWFWGGGSLFSVGMGACFYLMYYFVGGKVEKKKEGLRKSADLQDDCMFIHGALESPGIAQIYDDKLVLTPLISDQVTIPLSDIESVEERHWYNGSQYWGDNVYFKLNVRDKQSRIGFAVSRPAPWRKVLGKGD